MEISPLKDLGFVFDCDLMDFRAVEGGVRLVRDLLLWQDIVRSLGDGHLAGKSVVT